MTEPKNNHGRETEASEPPPRLSEELGSLLVLADGRSLALRKIVEHLRFRGLPALVVLLCVPFLFPVALPGLSLPFGVAIAFCGLRLGLGKSLWHPRMGFVQRWPGMLNLLGFMIMVGGILLSLPIPPPFPLTNTIPALSVIFISLGLIERDGLFILIGYFFALLGVSYIALIGFLGVAGVQSLWQWLVG